MAKIPCPCLCLPPCPMFCMTLELSIKARDRRRWHPGLRGFKGCWSQAAAAYRPPRSAPACMTDRHHLRASTDADSPRGGRTTACWHERALFGTVATHTSNEPVCDEYAHPVEKAFGGGHQRAQEPGQQKKHDNDSERIEARAESMIC